MATQKEQIQSAMSALGVSHMRDLATLIGTGWRSVAGWSADERAIPGPAAILLRLIADGQVSPADVDAAGRNMRTEKIAAKMAAELSELADWLTK
jgi:hypothetical protein